MNKKIRIILTIVAFILIGIGIYIEIDKMNKEDKKEKEEYSYMPLLYKICDDDSCVYTLGSIHLGDKNINKFDKKVLDIFNSTETLVVEVDITNETTDLSEYLLEEGTLDDILSEELKQKIITFSESHPVLNYEIYKMYNLGYLYTLLATLPYIELGYTNPGVDSYFLTLAHNSNKEIIELETMEEQQDLLLNGSNEFYETQIDAIIDNYDVIKQLAQNIYTSYTGSNEEMLKLYLSMDSEAYTEEEKEFTDSIYSDRNISMTEEVKRLLADNKNAFIVVGSAHVIGEDGIVNNLKNDYKVELIKD